MESHEAVSESIPYGLTNLKGFVGPTVQLLYQHFQIVNCEPWSISSFVFSHSQICHSWLFSLWTGFVCLDSAFIGKRVGTHLTMGRKQRDKHDNENVTSKKWQENNTKLHFSLIMQTKNLLVLRKGFVRTHARRAPFPAQPEYIFLLRLFEKIFSDHSKASLVIRGR